MAFDQGAVPEVLGGAGVLVSDKDPYALAGAIHAAAGRRAPCGPPWPRPGSRRLGELDLAAAADRFVSLLVPLVGAGAASS